MAYPEAISEYSPSFQIFIKKIHNRIENGKNALILLAGATGGGKSLSGIQILRGLYLYRYGEEPLDEYLISHVFFKARDFMENMNNPDLKKKEEWMWDEVGVDAGHKDALTKKNKIIGWVVQTFRNLQQVVIFTVPSIGMIDATVRKLLHYYIEVLHIDYKKGICMTKPLELQYNIRYDKLYYHNLTYPTNSGLLEIQFMGIPKVSDEIEAKYEEIKNKFTGDLNEEIFTMLDKMDKQQKAVVTSEDIENKLTERQSKILEMFKAGEGSNQVIAKEIGCALSIISANFNFMRNKGVNVDYYLKKNRVTIKKDKNKSHTI